MKKILGLTVLGGLVIAAVVFFAVNPVSAGDLRGLGTPGDGPGRNGGGALGKYMTQATAEVFGMTTAELQTALDSDKSLMDIAAEKGLSVKDFQNKMQEVRNKAVDLALAAGDITQTQADWMKSQARPGTRMGGKRGGMMWGDGYLHDEMIAAVAGVLGLDAKDLETRLNAGERLPDIATKQGIALQDWPVKMKEAMTTVIKEAVKNGKLTQAQADLILQRLENRGNRSPRFGDGSATPPGGGPQGDGSMGPGGEGFMGPDGLIF